MALSLGLRASLALVVASSTWQAAAAQSVLPAGSGKLLLTGGITTVEGAAGGGLTPWALIGSYGSKNQVGLNGSISYVGLPDYHLTSVGAMVGLYDRVELSFAQQRFDTEKVGGALGLGNGFAFKQNILGAKVRLFGDAVLEQDSWVPQVSVGLQYKDVDQEPVIAFVGAADDKGVDFYISATKLFLDANLLTNATVRFTKANQFGILGFGGDQGNSRKAQFEGSVAYLVTRKLAVGGEYRMKPDNLGIADENDAFDLFVAWAPAKNVTLTAAYVDLGNIVIADNQQGVFLQLQLGF